MNNELQAGHRYLIKTNSRYGYTERLYELTVIEVSGTAYKLLYDGALKVFWQSKDDFHYEYSIIENLPILTKWKITHHSSSQRGRSGLA